MRWNPFKRKPKRVIVYQPGPYRDFVFVVIVIFAIITAFWVKGFILGGMFTGILSTIGLWTLVLKCPAWLLQWMKTHPLMADLLLSLSTPAILATMVPGVTLFVAISTQAALMSVLLKTL